MCLIQSDNAVHVQHALARHNIIVFFFPSLRTAQVLTRSCCRVNVFVAQSVVGRRKRYSNSNHAQLYCEFHCSLYSAASHSTCSRIHVMLLIQSYSRDASFFRTCRRNIEFTETMVIALLTYIPDVCPHGIIGWQILLFDA
jgi:hypothetical protein